jgi:hypothetical protein
MQFQDLCWLSHASVEERIGCHWSLLAVDSRAMGQSKLVRFEKVEGCELMLPEIIVMAIELAENGGQGQG